MSSSADAFIADLQAIVGDAHVLTEANDRAAFEADWRGRYRGKARAVVRPANTDEVARVVSLCREVRVPIVPQAVNTGLVGGSVPDASGSTIVLSVGRMSAIRAVDVENNSMTVDAGCILANVREAAAARDRQFPMLLGSVGSCQVGGLVSSNAGGTGVIRYGNMRELVLGLEVVLPDGQIWNGLRALRKDNAGYDMKHLFIGAEGTLGIVTAAVFKLFPAHTQSATAMISLTSVGSAISLLHRMQATVGHRIEAFEIMSRNQIEIVCAHGHGLTSPMVLDAPWYVLVEIADSDPGWDASAQLEAILSEAVEAELLLDAVIATDLSKAGKIWEIRHNISEANMRFAFTVSNDTSVPISEVADFIATVDARLSREVEAATNCFVGHVGDGNIHVIALLSREHYATAASREAEAAKINFIVHEESVARGGSIAAEHGIGLMHLERLERFKPAVDLDMMRRIKQAFDPLGIMNPGKVIRS